MKVNGSTTAQQINWQQIADNKQQKLADAAKGQALKKIKEDQI